MSFFKSISDAFSNLWNKISKKDADSTHRKPSEDKYNKPRAAFSSNDSYRQSDPWRASNAAQERATYPRETREFSRPLSSYREESIQSRVSSVPSSQSRSGSVYPSYDTNTRTSLVLPSKKESTLPRRSSTSPAPALTPQRAYSTNYGYTSAVSSTKESAQFKAASTAIASKLTPQPASAAYLEYKQRPLGVSSRGEQSQQQLFSASTQQLKPQTFYSAHAGLIQPRNEDPSVTRSTLAQQAYKENKQQTQLGRSLSTTERSVTRRSLVLTDRDLHSPLQATRRSSATELLPERNRIPKTQFQALNKHINSYYVQNLRSLNQDYVFVEDGFEGKQSSYRNTCLPYRPDQVNTWFREVVRRDPAAEPAGKPYKAYIDMINLMKTDDFRTMLTAVAKFRTIRLEDGEEMYFHATDAQSARSILENGIDLAQTKDRQDFSNGYGFYITTDYKRSTEWATRKASKFCHSTGAIIAFKVSRQLQQEQVHLYLEVNTAEGRRNWEKTVSHFRNGEAIGALSVLLGNVKFIRGPVSRNAFLRPGEVPVAYDFTQVCLCDEEYAERYGSLQNICFVIFFKVD